MRILIYNELDNELVDIDFMDLEEALNDGWSVVGVFF